MMTKEQMFDHNISAQRKNILNRIENVMLNDNFNQKRKLVEIENLLAEYQEKETTMMVENNYGKGA